MSLFDSVITPEWPSPKNIRALTTTKSVWGERTAIYPDIPLDDDLVRLGHLPAGPAWVLQRHTSLAIRAPFTTPTGAPTDTPPTADATFTDTPGCVLAVLTADCLPILLCDDKGQHIAAIHAGWRGLAANIIENTLRAMHDAFGPQHYLAWLGPAIGPSQFEVGHEVYEAFVSQDDNAAQAFTPISQAPQAKWLANLYLLATQRLHKQKVTQIYGGNHCTYRESDLFFSYRRDAGKTGRMASVIWIEN